MRQLNGKFDACRSKTFRRNVPLTIILLLSEAAFSWSSTAAQDGSADAATQAIIHHDAILELAVPQEPAAVLNQSQSDDFWTRSTMTGDWGGLRSELRDSGIIFRGKTTQFGFGVSGGVNTPVPSPLGQGNSTAYTGRAEYDTILDLEKIAGIPKGKLLIRFEHWYGQYGNVSLRTGAFTPAVFPAMTPTSINDPGVPYLTNFLWTQPLTQDLLVYGGKVDVLGSTDQDIFAGGDGSDQFMNQALIVNPSFLLGIPYSSLTAGVVKREQWGSVRGFLYDPNDRTTEYFRLDNIFNRGIILGCEAKLKSSFLDKPGEHHLGGIWKHVPLTNLSFQEPPPGVYPEPTVPGFPTLNDSFTLFYGFDQYLVQFGNSDRGYGLFGRASISDGNPTPVQYFLSAGLGGYSPIAQKRGDTFGIGWYFVGTSNQFGPIPQALFGPRNGSGVEVYYNFQVNPWLNITPDVQYMQPGASAISTDTAFVYGIRANASF
jgi:porin